MEEMEALVHPGRQYQASRLPPIFKDSEEDPSNPRPQRKYFGGDLGIPPCLPHERGC